MIINSPKYHYKITWGISGTQYDVRLQKPVELTRKQVTKEIFFRTESTEWIILRWQNPMVYDKLMEILADIEGTTYPIYALVHYYADGINFTKAEYAGLVALDGIVNDKYAGKLTFKPKPFDAYTWYDDCKDNKVCWKLFKNNTMVQKFISYSKAGENPNPWRFFSYAVSLSDLTKWICSTYAWKYEFHSQFMTDEINPITNEANRVKATYLTLGYFGKIDAEVWSATRQYYADEIVVYIKDSTTAYYYKCLRDNINQIPPTVITSDADWEQYEPINDDNAMEFQISDIFDLLKNRYNIYWYIDPYTNYIIFEHYRYFRRGKDYNGAVAVGVDLTDETIFPQKLHVLKDFNGNYYQNIEYRLEEVVGKNTYKDTASIYAPISLTYDSYLATQNKTNDITMGKVLGEIILFKGPTNYPKLDDSLLVLLNVDITNIGDINLPVRLEWVNFPVVSGNNTYTVPPYGEPIENGGCYLQYLFPLFMIYGRELDKGTLNGKLTDFPNAVNYKFQTVRFPRIVLESDYYELPLLMKTELGKGNIEEIKIICDTGWTEVKVGFNSQAK